MSVDGYPVSLGIRPSDDEGLFLRRNSYSFNDAHAIGNGVGSFFGSPSNLGIGCGDILSFKVSSVTRKHVNGNTFSYNGLNVGYNLSLTTNILNGPFVRRVFREGRIKWTFLNILILKCNSVSCLLLQRRMFRVMTSRSVIASRTTRIFNSGTISSSYVRVVRRSLRVQSIRHDPAPSIVSMLASRVGLLFLYMLLWGNTLNLGKCTITMVLVIATRSRV